MKAVFAIAATVAVANAALLPRQLDQIPACALSCATTSLGSTGCAVTDFKCICSNSAFVTSLTPCVQKACSAAEFEQTVKAASGLCAAAGVSLSIPAGAASTGASSSAAATETSAAATTSAPATETSMMSSAASTEAPTSAMSSESMTAAPTTSAGAATTSAPTSSMAGNSTMTTTRPPQPTGTEPGAASRNTVALGGLGAIIALVAAFL